LAPRRPGYGCGVRPSEVLHDALAGGGEMGERIRSHDWTATPLGPIERWPQSLKTSLSLILNAQMPMWLGWTPEMYFFYNDAYVGVLSHAKHPWALGRPASEVWREVWPVCGTLADNVFHRAEASFVEDLRLFMDRGAGFLEEVYYSFSYSPIRDASGRVAGLFCPCTEVSAKLINARRLRTLSELGARVLSERTIDGALASAAATLAKNTDDLPFALIYLAERDALVLRQAVRVPAGLDDARWQLDETFRHGRMVVQTIDPDPALPLGLAGLPVREVVALPIAAAADARPLGVLVAGVNPTRRLDAEHITFFELVAGQVGSALHNAQAAEETKRRADALAELDRSKTIFFSNVSHEFRTPLTLMIGPTEDALGSPERTLGGEALEMVYRNELRLLKLVNALLDFSRLEAGRMQACFEPVNLVAMTADLANGFRAAIERAGLALHVDTQPLEGPIAVDRDMWEKIVLNLLSNAVKFTLAGSISVRLHQTGESVTLEVADTGTGIPSSELPRLFERFHRIENPGARTQEGTGIGLALVHELARLLGGEVSVDSEVGRGSTFRVTIPARQPAGTAATEPRSATSVQRLAHVSEAERMISKPIPDPDTGSSSSAGTEHVLLADDNADMREYLQRLLGAHFRVTAVENGARALAAAIADEPDLVVSDVMMPELDGFGLLAALRGREQTRHVPVILLSARAGDESRIEGLGAGADDYLVKPFSARELVARVNTHLALARARKTAERSHEELYALMMQVPAAIMVCRGPELRCVFQNDASLAVLDQRGKTVSEGWRDGPTPWVENFARVYETGESVTERELAATRVWSPGEAPSTRYFDVTWAAVRLTDGQIDGVMSLSVDVTERVVADERARLAWDRLEAALTASQIGTYFWDMRSQRVEHDVGVKRLFGFSPEHGHSIDDYTARIHPEDRSEWLAALEASAQRGLDFHQEYRVVRDDAVHWLLDKGHVVRDAAGPAYMIGAVVDITEPKRLANAALAASRAKDEFLAMLGHELRNPLAPIVTALAIMKLRDASGSKERSTLERQVKHLVRLVDDLLDISRVTRGLIDLHRERLALRDVVSKAVEIASPLIEQKQHQLSVDLPAGLFIDADAVRLAQVFANLLTNAARYTPANGKIAVSASRLGDRIQVRVSDNGIGIASDQLESIFELFVQGGERSVARSEGGLGIGLALVRNLLKLHDATVVATSEGPGTGSTFTVELHAALAPEPSREAASPAALSATTRRVLVVDDNIDAADMLCAALQHFGHEVVIARDALQALGLVDEFHPDVAVLDIGLPGMDGYELARRLRARGLDQCLLIAVTGYGQDDDRVRSRAAGFDVHLVKPVDLMRLASLIDKADMLESIN
jgi:signal transduction histidine kinase/DNA-binding response OmpR family regulator